MESYPAGKKFGSCSPEGRKMFVHFHRAVEINREREPGVLRGRTWLNERKIVGIPPSLTLFMSRFHLLETSSPGSPILPTEMFFSLADCSMCSVHITHRSPWQGRGYNPLTIGLFGVY